MYYNIKDITQYFENFSPYEGHFTEDDVDDFISSINGSPYFDYDSGATKLVIIPKNTQYVIKIPFTGQYIYEEDYYDEELEEWVEPENWSKYFDFIGALSENGNNYIEAEVKYYEAAVEEGWEELFLPVEYVYDWEGIPVYIQQKADLVCIEREQDQDKYASNESKSKCLSIRNSNHTNWWGLDKFPISWVASLMDKLGSFEQVKDFVSFLEREGIYSDLHCANIGYANGHAVIVDYGGYQDN